MTACAARLTSAATAAHHGLKVPTLLPAAAAQSP
jgi:hypothetical protein